MRVFLTPKTLRRFEIIQSVLVPRFASFSNEQILESRCLINSILAGKSFFIHLKIKFFLVFIDFVSWIVSGNFFSNLYHSKPILIFYLFFNSSIALLRIGFWGVNTLAKLGVYGQVSFYPEIGYQQ